MSTAAAGTAAATETVKPRVINPWIVALAVIIPTFMEVLDTTIANVALRYIAGGLSAPSSDSEWVITSYLAANAIILPMSGWLSVRLGRRRYFLISIAVFTLASVLCGLATNLEISLRLGEYLDSLNPAVNSFFEQAQSYLLQLTGDPVAARQMALQALENLRQQQSSALAYFDTFFVFAVLSIPLVAFVFMMKRSVAQKGGHTAAE